MSPFTAPPPGREPRPTPDTADCVGPFLPFEDWTL